MRQLHTYQFPMRFDTERLRQDLERVPQTQWVAHFATIHSTEGWDGVALRSLDGASTGMHSGRADNYVDTDLLKQCPYFREVLESFQCPRNRVRLLKLDSGATVKEHIDYGSGYNQEEIRVHIPIVTHQDFEFYSNSVRMTMNPGEVWFLDTSYPHRLVNRSSVDRVHLVIDCEVNDWIKSLLPAEMFVPTAWQVVAQRFRFIRYSLLDVIRAWRAGPEEKMMRKKFLIRQLGLLHFNQLSKRFWLRLKSALMRS